MQSEERAQRRSMTIPEAAAWIGISRSLAYEQAARNAFPVPVVRIGRRMLVSRAAIEAAFPDSAATVADAANDSAA